jgi:hypothetical protein
MKRSAPLRRRKPLRRKSLSKSRQRRDAARDFAYLAWVRSQGCAVGKDCYGRVHAHHATMNRAFSRKAPDRESFGLCAKNHDQLHQATGFFQDWNREQRREWQRSMVAEMVARYAPRKEVA